LLISCLFLNELLTSRFQILFIESFGCTIETIRLRLRRHTYYTSPSQLK